MLPDTGSDQLLEGTDDAFTISWMDITERRCSGKLGSATFFL